MGVTSTQRRLPGRFTLENAEILNFLDHLQNEKKLQVIKKTMLLKDLYMG